LFWVQLKFWKHTAGYSTRIIWQEVDHSLFTLCQYGRLTNPVLFCEKLLRKKNVNIIFVQITPYNKSRTLALDYWKNNKGFWPFNFMIRCVDIRLLVQRGEFYASSFLGCRTVKTHMTTLWLSVQRSPLSSFKRSIISHKLCIQEAFPTDDTRRSSTWDAGIGLPIAWQAALGLACRPAIGPLVASQTHIARQSMADHIMFTTKVFIQEVAWEDGLLANYVLVDQVTVWTWRLVMLPADSSFWRCLSDVSWTVFHRC